MTDARNETDARDRARRAARAKILDDDWRPRGALLIGGLDVKGAPTRPAAANSPHAAAAVWRAEAASHLQGAIDELDRASSVMPVSLERELTDLALRTTSQTFRVCTRNLEAVRQKHRPPRGSLECRFAPRPSTSDSAARSSRCYRCLPGTSKRWSRCRSLQSVGGGRARERFHANAIVRFRSG